MAGAVRGLVVAGLCVAWGVSAAAVEETAVAFDPALCGRKVRVSFEVFNPGALAVGSKLEFRQYDAAGRRLNEDVVDPRWISMMHPAGKRSPIAVEGSVHPRTAKIALAVDAFDEGRLVVEKACVEPVPARAVNTNFFAAGVEGEALSLSRTRQFFFPVYSRAVWGQGLSVTNAGEVFFPSGTGTVEAWLRPASWAGKTVLFDAASCAPGSANGKKARGSLFGVTYEPKTGALAAFVKGTDGRVFTASGPCDLVAGRWHHMAVVFAVGEDLAVFVDGRRVAAAPLKGWCAPVTGDPGMGAMLFAFGVDAKTARTSSEREIDSFVGLLDNLRISSVVRYRQDFTAERTRAKDEATRALFAFEKEIDGWSAGADGFVEASIRADEALYPGDAKTTFARPRPFDVFNYKDVCTEEDFTSCRVGRSVTRELAPGGSFALDLPEHAVPDWTEIRNTSTDDLVAPAVVREGEVDPRTWQTIRETIGLEGLSDREKADKLFQYAVRSLDYFMWHPACLDPGKLHGGGPNNHPLATLNAFGGDSCGGLNKVASNLATLCGDIPACAVAGYGHEFQQYLLDARPRVYDLSGQQYFERLSDDEPASLQEIEREPGTHPRYQKSADHFTRLFSHSPWNSRPYFMRKYLLTLKPGESFRFSRFNDGNVIDVWPFKKNGHAKVPDHPLAAPVPPEAPLQAAFRINRFLPDLANGCVSYEGAAPEKAYEVDFVYPVVRAEYRAYGADGASLPLEYSFDGETWKELARDADGTARPVYAVRGLPRYTVRAKGGVPARFTAKTFVQMNPRVTTGLARAGHNVFAFKAERGGRATVAVGWKERGGRIAVEGAAYAGVVPGAEKLIVAYDPSEGSRTLRASGVKGGEVVLDYPDKGRPYYVHRRLAGTDGGEALLTVLVGRGARLVLNDGTMKGRVLAKKGDGVAFATDLKGEGRFMLWNLTRIEGALPHTRMGNRSFAKVVATAKRTKDRYLACGPTRCGSDFYKAATGTKGGRAAYHWDTAGEPGTRYPTGAPRTYSAAELASVRYELTQDWQGGIEYFASLIVPVGDHAFQGETIKLLSGFSYLP